MWKKRIAAIGLAVSLALGAAAVSYADTTEGITMENCGAYLFVWRPVDLWKGHYFAIPAGGNTIQESDSILNRGYDYAFTFNNSIPKPWGTGPVSGKHKRNLGNTRKLALASRRQPVIYANDTYNE